MRMCSRCFGYLAGSPRNSKTSVNLLQRSRLVLRDPPPASLNIVHKLSTWTRYVSKTSIRYDQKWAYMVVTGVTAVGCAAVVVYQTQPSAVECATDSGTQGTTDGTDLVRINELNWSQRCEVIATALSMNKCGINQGTSGNVSARVSGGFLITPSGMPYDSLKPSDVVFVDDDGGYYGPLLPSSEWRMHFDIYRRKPDAMAIVHAHPTHCTTLAVQRKGIPPFHYMVAAAGGKEIVCADYATFGSQELSDNILAAMTSGQHACLMANHGMICYGKNLSKALGLAIEVECLARQYIAASTMGSPVLLDDAEMDIILAKFRTYGKQPDELRAMGAFDVAHAVHRLAQSYYLGVLAR